jgi:hypothetical protein
MRFYSRNTDKPRFNSEVDEDNWYACHRAISRLSDKDKDIIIRVYRAHDTIADNIYDVAITFNIDQTIIWDLLKNFERSVARKRGLL